MNQPKVTREKRNRLDSAKAGDQEGGTGSRMFLFHPYSAASREDKAKSREVREQFPLPATRVSLRRGI